MMYASLTYPLRYQTKVAFNNLLYERKTQKIRLTFKNMLLIAQPYERNT